MSDDPIKTVYMADDEPDIRVVAEMSLSTIAGWKTTLFPEGLSMLEFARANPPPDALLLDVMMPGMDGVTLLGELRAIPGYETTPAVFLTARAQRHEVQGYLEAGAAGVITKPFDPMQLPQRIRELVLQARPRIPAKPGLSDRLAALRTRYIGRLPGKLDALRQAFDAFVAAPDPERFATLRTQAHKLHGTGGSYGLAEVSEAAGALERVVIGAGDSGLGAEAEAAGRASIDALDRLVDQL